MTDYSFSLVPEGPLRRLHVRRALGGKQLQHVLASAYREADVPSPGQPGPRATDADPGGSPAREPLTVRADVDATLERREAKAVPCATPPWQTEAAAPLPPEVPQEAPEAEHAPEAQEQKAGRHEEKEPTPEGAEKTRQRHVVDDHGNLGRVDVLDDGRGVFSIDDRAGGGRSRVTRSLFSVAATVALIR